MNRYNSVDRYCYPGTDVLINKENITDAAKLEIIEGAYSRDRIQELTMNPIEGNFDLKHLQKIHHYIFQDIYPFAGQIRDLNIIKGNTTFCASLYIKSSADELFSSLKNENFLKDLPFDQFTKRLAHYYSEINILHPFREGNGRSQRVFLSNVSKNAGFQLDWSKTNKDLLLKATIESVVNTRSLEKVFENTLIRSATQPIKNKFLDLGR